MELKIIDREDNITQVALVGHLDTTATQKIDGRFQAATVVRGNPTIVDLSNLDFIASLGIGMLLSAARGLHSKGVGIVLAGPKGAVETTLRRSSLDSVLPIAANLAKAEELLKH